jgi:tetratricopeptide (TPR) repeat protein
VAIKGSLKEASLPDVLQLLALGQKTGCLTIADRSNLGHIYFERGRIVDASIVNRRDRLGDILVKNGKVSRRQLDTAIEEQHRARERRVGELLVSQGAISRDDLEHYVRVQIEEAVFFLFTWSRGTFHFESDVRPEHQEFPISINPESLLLEGARRIDEWSLIEKKMPSFDIIFALDREHLETSGVTLTADQERIVPLLDGERDVSGVIEESGLGEFEVGKALYGLITAGFAHRAGRSQPRVTEQVGDGRLNEHRNLGIAFYKAGMLDEASREFRRVVELKPADGAARFYVGLIALKQAQWQEAADHLRAAADLEGDKPAILYNLALAFERAGRLEEAEATYAEATAKARHDARILTGWGIAALRRGDYEVAAGRLERAREVSREEARPVLWYWSRALAAAGLEHYDDAEATLREGLERHPDHVVLKNNLAVLLEVRGEMGPAEDLLRAALVEDPSLPQLSKNLGDLLYRAGKFDDAWDSYQRAVRLEPQLGDDVYFRLGNIAYKRRDRGGAMEYWQRVVELNPKHELARTNLETMKALT